MLVLILLVDWSSFLSEKKMWIKIIWIVFCDCKVLVVDKGFKNYYWVVDIFFVRVF